MITRLSIEGGGIDVKGTSSNVTIDDTGRLIGKPNLMSARTQDSEHGIEEFTP